MLCLCTILQLVGLILSKVTIQTRYEEILFNIITIFFSRHMI